MLNEVPSRFRKAEVAPVIRISLPYIYKLASALEPLVALEVRDVPLKDVFVVAIVAQNAVRELTTSALYAPYLRVSYQLAQDLLSALEVATKIAADYQSVVIPHYQMYRIHSAAEQYKIVLLADLGILHSYFVSQKGAFDTLSLLTFAGNMFPSDLGGKVPEAMFDVREAGKCLAYETSTAAGFHLFRALESVLRAYYAHETGSKAPPKVRNIAVYVHAMREAKKGDERVLFLVKEISDRFRNPLVHPEVVLTTDDAIAIHGLVRTAITEMLKPLPVLDATTATALISDAAAS